MVERKKDVPAGDLAAWRHAIATRLQMLDEEDVKKLVELALYTREVVEKESAGMTEAELEHLLQWADRARLGNALLENALRGCAFVHVSLGTEPRFALTPKGEREAIGIGEKLGLPPLHEEES